MKNLFLLILLTLSCKIATAPIYGERYYPPAIYEQYWTEVEECSGLQGDYNHIKWYQAKDGGLGRGVVGRWDYPHTITLTEFVVSREIQVTIKHEMLHDLIQSGEHPTVFDRCNLGTF